MITDNRNKIRNNKINRRAAYIKRTAVVRRQRSILLAVFVIVFAFTAICFTNRVHAGNFNLNSDSVKMYKSVTIYSGDTFESIAQKYMTNEYSSVNKYICELTSINGMSSDSKLIPGNKIIVPYYMSKSISSNPVIEISLAK